MVEPLKVFDMLKMLADGKTHPIHQFVGSIDGTPTDITEAIQVIGHEYGIIIHQPQPNHYQLDAPITWLSEEAVYALLSPKAQSAFTLSFVKALDSTNAQLKALAQKNPCIGLVLASEWQSHGYGKSQRKWHMQIGQNLAFSLLWAFDRPLSDLSGITLATGVAVVEALNRFNICAKLKWPNDIVLHQKKLGGILVESLTSSAYPSLFVIGIGLNTKTPTFTGCEAIGCNISNRNQLFAYLLDALYLALIKLSEEGFKVFQQAWEAHCVHLNQVVDLLIPNTPVISGIFKGINQQGALILETEGETTTYQMGEISLRTTKCSY